MYLTERQIDALTELINIAFSRTAASLSELTGHRVMLDVPQVEVHPINDLTGILSKFVTGEVATVHQTFKGAVSGDALLLLNYEGAVMLTYLLTDEPVQTHRLDASAKEVLTEVGNILLNACLGMFGNLLKVHLIFSVPQLELESLNGVVNSLITGKEVLHYALVIHTSFRLKDGQVNGYMMIVLGVASLERLIEAVEDWERRLTKGE
jgi:chemotaxis protein CheC